VAYYYLMAQLPYLMFEQKPPMSSASFKDLCSYQLIEADNALMVNLSLVQDKYWNIKTGCSFIDNWREWDRSFRTNLAKQRAVKLKKDPSSIKESAGIQMDILSVISKAMDESSPLDGETIIDKARWSAIESFTGSEYFDRNHVYAYYLKLLLLERRQYFDTEKGFAEYKSLYASIVESGQESRGEIINDRN